MRTIIGVLGIMLPVILLLGDSAFLKGAVGARGSLSAYYHSGMRDFFVGVLIAVAFALFAYKLFVWSLDNALRMVAGFATVTVAIFPTATPEGKNQTPLQQRLNEGVVEVIHFASAAIFICSLGIICYLFGRRESQRHRIRPSGIASAPAKFWKWFHCGSAFAIGLAIVFIGATKATGVLDQHALLIGESVAGLAFGLSWLAKGLDFDRLLGHAPG
jgi:hypothetical protein